MKKISIFLFSFILVESAFAQYVSNIPYQSLLQVNPSFAGSNGGVRNQAFAEVLASPKNGYYSNSFSNNFDCYLPSLKSGIGVSFNYTDFNHIIRTGAGNLTYSKYLKIGEKLNVIPSVQGGCVRREIYNDWIYSASGVPPSSGWASTNAFSFGYGLLLNYKNLYGGFSFSNVNYPPMNFLNPKRYFYTTYQVNASYNLNLTENVRLNFCGQYFSQRVYNMELITVNALLYKHFLVGVTQANDGLGFNAGIKADFFTAQISYRKYLSRLVPYNYADYLQFMLSFNLRNKELRHSLTNFEAW